MTESKRAVTDVDEMATYADERFKLIGERSQEIMELTSKLHTMIYRKFDALLGSVPTSEQNMSEKGGPESCWIGDILSIQNETIRTCRESLERLAVV